ASGSAATGPAVRAPTPVGRWPDNQGQCMATGKANDPLVESVRRESAVAICQHWGVTPQTVTLWRKALGVGPTTEGTSRLRRDHFGEPWALEARATAHAKNSDPGRRAKIAASRRGKPRPRHVVEAERAALAGKRLCEETR